MTYCIVEYNERESKFRVTDVIPIFGGLAMTDNESMQDGWIPLMDRMTNRESAEFIVKMFLESRKAGLKEAFSIETIKRVISNLIYISEFQAESGH